MEKDADPLFPDSKLPDDVDTCESGCGYEPWWTLYDYQASPDAGYIPWYKQYIAMGNKKVQEMDIKKLLLVFPLGARFSVSRRRIHMRPKSYYETLLDLRTNNIDPMTGFYLEATWYDMFHPDKLQALYGPPCALPKMPDESQIVSQQKMYQRVKAKLDSEGTSYDYIGFRLPSEVKKKLDCTNGC